MSFQLAWPWLLASLPLPLLAAMLPAAPERPRAGLRFPFPGVLRSVSAGRPSERSSRSSAMACLPIAVRGWRMVVNEGLMKTACGTSSKPVTEKSCGIL